MPGKIMNAPKAEIIAFLYSVRNEASVRALLNLLDIMINDLRIDNDTAERDDVFRNQGGIDVLKELKDKLTRALPTIPKIA
jgi:hypothetical protein